MIDTPQLRITILLGGTAVMVGCAVLGFISSGLFYTLWPSMQPQGRLSFFVPFAPLTALLILGVGAIWMRRNKPSTIEGLGALLSTEAITWGIVAFFAGESFSFPVFAFWLGANLIFAPSWLLMVWLTSKSKATSA
jgi:hypothetical protein